MLSNKLEICRNLCVFVFLESRNTENLKEKEVGCTPLWRGRNSLRGIKW